MSRQEPTMTVWCEPSRKLPWLVRWREYVTGHPPKQRTRSFATEGEARQFRTAAVTLATQPDPSPAAPRTGTLGEYLELWLTDTIKPHREAATHRSYEQLVRIHIVPRIGAWPLVEVGAKRVRSFYNDLHAAGVGLATRRHVHAVLSSAMTQAFSDEEIEINPVLKLGRWLRHKDEAALDPEPNPFTREELDAFLMDVATHEPDWTEYFQFLADTGVRIGEVAALRWKDATGKPLIDLDGKRAKIEASYSPSDGKDKAPKTHQRRYIDLTDLVVTQLLDVRQRQRRQALSEGRAMPGYVFTLKNGSPRRQDGNMRRVFGRIIARCQLTGHTPHDFRDTFATLHLTADYSKLPWVSRQLGHETERTTVDHYFRFLPSATTKGFANQIRGSR